MSATNVQRFVGHCVLLIGTAAAAQADTLEVPAEHGTIQAAIVAAVAGDTVVVSPGHYAEQVDFLGKAIEVRSSDGPDVTTIDAGGSGTVVTFDTGESNDSVLEGFRVTGGDSGGSNGGGVRVDGAAPTIRNCWFRLNEGQDGAGIWLGSSAGAVIDSCRFEKNAANGSGGGLYASLSTVTVRDSSFRANSAGTDGGGLASTGGNLSIEGCHFIGNSASSDGGGVHMDGAGAVLSCSVTLNIAEDGGGIYLTGSGPATVAGCMVVENDASRFGGGIDIVNTSPTITNCSVSNNAAGTSQAGIGGFNTNPTIANTLVWTNIGVEMGFNGSSFPNVSFCNVQGGFAGTSNIDANPLFRSSLGGNYRLGAGSPCIDSGDDFATGVPSTDFDGEPLVATVDIGADEFAAEGGLFLDRHAPNDVRVMCFNVLNDSIFPGVDPVQAAKFERMIDALAPDVLCLQEVYVSEAQVASLMNSIAPLGGGDSWQVVRALDRGDALVSRYPISMQAVGTVPAGWRGPAMALVDLPDAQFPNDLYVITTHYKCCGADFEDNLRQQQSDAIVNWIRDARTPGGSIDLPAGTGIVVAGDLNLVHSFQPVTTLLRGDIVDESTYGADAAPDWDGTAMTDARPVHNGRERFDYTWRNDNGSFAPGRLDFVTYTDSVLETANTFILNTGLMSTNERNAAGLQIWDVTADSAGERYDHLPLIVDFRPPSSSSQRFCDASDGALSSCPCVNPGLPDSGCEIAQTTGGVQLSLVGQSTALPNRATVSGTGFPAASTPTAIVIRGTALDPAAPVVFGDGIRCVGTPLVRLAGTFALSGTSVHTFGHGTMAGAGDFYYQLWFRNTPAMYCTPDAFNLSNGRSLTW